MTDAAKVVVIEDEPQIRRFVCDAVRKESCAAGETGTAGQGFDTTAVGGVQLDILDLARHTVTETGVGYRFQP